MSRYDFLESRRLVRDDPPFAALLMAAMWRADTDNMARLRSDFPAVYAELVARYEAPGDHLAPNPGVYETGATPVWVITLPRFEDRDG